MKKIKRPGMGWKRWLAIGMLASILASCGSPSAMNSAGEKGPAEAAGLVADTGGGAPAQDSILPSATATRPAATPSATAAIEAAPAATETPTAAPDPTPVFIPDGVAFDYQPIPMGKPLVVTANDRRVTVRVNRVYTGADAAAMAWSPPPDTMQYVVVQLVVDYQQGAPGVREQVLDPYSFHMVSKGNTDPGSAYFSPEPYLGNLRLEPGMDSLAYLVFAAYADDPSPLMRYDLDGQSHFFSLGRGKVAPVLPDVEVSLALENGLGTLEQPVPLGSPAYVDYQGVVYEVQVQRMLRGYRAYTRINDGWNIEGQPGQGQEYILPYISMRVARAPTEMTFFTPNIFTTYSDGETWPAPASKYCPAPCLSSAQLYPDGMVQGWAPLFTQSDDPAPLLVFDNRVYFRMIDPAEDPQVSSPNAINYTNRDHIQADLTLKQVGPVQAIAFAPDSSVVVTAGDDKQVHVWDPTSGAELHTLGRLAGSLKDVAFSPDGSRLAAVSSAGEVWVWQTSDWGLQSQLQIQGSGLGVRYLPDGRLLVLNNSGQIKLWNADGSLQGLDHAPLTFDRSCANAFLYSYDLSADGATIAVSLTCGFGLVWKLGDPRVVWAGYNRQSDLMNLQKLKAGASVIRLSPDGRLAMFGIVYYIQRRLTLMDVIDLNSGQVIASVGPTDLDMQAARIAPGGDLLLAGVSDRVMVWWPEAYQRKKQNMLELNGHLARVTAIQFSPDSQILASGDYNGVTTLWRVK